MTAVQALQVLEDAEYHVRQEYAEVASRMGEAIEVLRKAIGSDLEMRQTMGRTLEDFP